MVEQLQARVEMGFAVSGLSFTQKAGVLPGLFTVDEEGYQVRFSQGNLQYTTLGTHAVGTGGTEVGTWRFAMNQWDYVGTQTPGHNCDVGGTVSGSDNRLISATYSGWIDLFAWGTSGWNSGANAYMPYSTSQNDQDFYPGGNWENDLTGDYAEADWAWHNAISNGGNAAHQWRILTNDEWVYLFSTRTCAFSKLGFGNVNNENGAIILPDSWTLPAGLTFTSGNNDWSNEFTLVQWAEMEANGAVFLPAAGRRGVTGVIIVGSCGYYWSSTHYHRGGNAYNVDFSFSSGYLNPAHNYNRDLGFAVRPVHVAN